MPDKMRVKVIKKSETKPEVVTHTSVKATRVAAREMVSTVTDWVSEFKTRRADETRAAFDKLFSNQPQPNET